MSKIFLGSHMVYKMDCHGSTADTLHGSGIVSRLKSRYNSAAMTRPTIYGNASESTDTIKVISSSTTRFESGRFRTADVVSRFENASPRTTTDIKTSVSPALTSPSTNRRVQESSKVVLSGRKDPGTVTPTFSSTNKLAQESSKVGLSIRKDPGAATPTSSSTNKLTQESSKVGLSIRKDPGAATPTSSSTNKVAQGSSKVLLSIRKDPGAATPTSSSTNNVAQESSKVVLSGKKDPDAATPTSSSTNKVAQESSKVVLSGSKGSGAASLTCINRLSPGKSVLDATSKSPLVSSVPLSTRSTSDVDRLFGESKDPTGSPNDAKTAPTTAEPMSSTAQVLSDSKPSRRRRQQEESTLEFDFSNRQVDTSHLMRLDQVHHTPVAPDLNDFGFKLLNTNNPNGWAAEARELAALLKRPPSVCDVQFDNADIVIGSRSNLVSTSARSGCLPKSVSFCSSQPKVHSYPMETPGDATDSPGVRTNT